MGPRTKEKKKIKVVNNIFGTPTYAPILAEYILNKITLKKEWEKIEHFSQKKTMSWYDLANKITRKIKIKLGELIIRYPKVVVAN